MLDLSEINKCLADTDIYYFDSVGSTNDEAKRKAEKCLFNDILVIADEQTAGKGRMGRSFYSPKDTGAYFSYAFISEVNEDVLSSTVAAAVAVCEAIEELSALKPSIKWVNDIYLNGKKVSGILAESVDLCKIRCFIIGIGINVTTADFPPDLILKAGSLCTDVSREKLISAIVSRLKYYKNNGFKTAALEYKKRSAVLGKSITFTENGVSKRGIAADITDNGGLAVNCDGKTVVLSTGEISVTLDE